MARRSRTRSRSRDHKKKDKKEKSSHHHSRHHSRQESHHRDRDDSNPRKKTTDKKHYDENPRHQKPQPPKTPILGMPGAGGQNKDDVYAKLSEFPLKRSSGFSKWTDGPPAQIDEAQLQETNLAQIQADQNNPDSNQNPDNPLTTLQKEQSKLFNTVLEIEDEQQQNLIREQNKMVLERAEDELKLWKREESEQTPKLRTGFSNFGNNSFSYAQGCNPNIINTLNDTSKIKRKIYMPKTNKFNYTG